VETYQSNTSLAVAVEDISPVSGGEAVLEMSERAIARRGQVHRTGNGIGRREKGKGKRGAGSEERGAED
jgi:hypothetical protein